MEISEGSYKPIPVDNSKIKWRYIFAVLSSMGMGIIYGLKVNISVAIVAMVNHTALASLGDTGGHGGHGGHGEEDLTNLTTTVTPGADADSQDPEEVGPFIWNSKEQGAILGAYFVGYFITQVPGGRLAEMYSAKLVFLVATFVNTLGAVLTPLAAVLDFRVLLVLRVLQGLGGGVTFPAMNVMITAWSPANERSTITSIAYSGTSLGTVLSILTSGLLCSHLGWESVFYIQGGLSVFWCVMWVVFVTDTPASHRFINESEAAYIEHTKSGGGGGEEGRAKVATPIPWKSIFTSIPFLALSFSHLFNNFGWYMLLIELPLFMRTGLGVSMTINTIISSVPFLVNWIFSVVFSKCLDMCRSRNLINTTNARKLSVCTASLLPAACLLVICWSGDNVYVIVTLTILAVMTYGSMFSGVFSNHSDLAPNFAGTLMAFTNMLATLPGVLVPLLVGLLTEGKTGLAPWHIVFYLTAAILGLEAVVFVLLGSGELQSWNSPRHPGTA